MSCKLYTIFYRGKNKHLVFFKVGEVNGPVLLCYGWSRGPRFPYHHRGIFHMTGQFSSRAIVRLCNFISACSGAAAACALCAAGWDHPMITPPPDTGHWPPLDTHQSWHLHQQGFQWQCLHRFSATGEMVQKFPFSRMYLVNSNCCGKLRKYFIRVNGKPCPARKPRN